MARRQIGFGVGLLFALIAILHFWRLGAVPLYSVGEPREGVQVVDEYYNHSWILPLRNGVDVPSKPPLYHWLAGLTALAAGGVDEWVVRFPSAAVGVATVLAVGWFGARRWDALAGIAAACILATNFEWLKASHAARVDMTLTGCLTAAMLALGRIVEAPVPSPAARWTFYGAMALGVLAKGPVGIALPVLAALAYLALQRDLVRFRAMAVGRGMALAIGLPAVWYALAIAAGGMPFVRKQILRGNVLHFLGPGNQGVNLSHPVWYYGEAMAAGLAPWSLFLVPLAAYLWQNRRRRDVIAPYRLPLVWMAVVIGFYTVAASKRATYILAAYPAAALMLGGWWSAIVREPATMPELVRRLLHLLVLVSAGVTAIVVLMLLAHAGGLDPLEWLRPFLHRKDQQNLPLVRHMLDGHGALLAAWAATLVLASFGLLRGAQRARWGTVFVGLTVSVAATALAMQHAFMPRLAENRTYKPFVTEVMRLAGDSDRLFFYDTFDFGVVFYARRVVPVVRETLPAPPAWLILSERRYARFTTDEQRAMPVHARSDGTGPEGAERYLLVRR